MSDYLKKLFDIYLKTKEKIINDNIKFFDNKNKDFLLGDIYIVNENFLFLVVNKEDDYIVGYKVSEWIEFALNKDFIFEFNNNKWFAIIEKLIIPINLIGSFIGRIPQEYRKILTQFEYEAKPFPKNYSGLTVNKDAIQYKFREIELKEFLYFYKEKLNKKINELEFPLAARIEKFTSRGENFILYFEKEKSLLTIHLLDDFLKDLKVIKIKFLEDTYLFYNENNKINIEILRDDIDIDFISKNLKILK